MQYTKILSIVFLCSLLATMANAQQNTTVRGLVVDKNGNSIPGVLIKISPVSKGLLSDAHGEFSVDLPSARTYRLEFSFMGFRNHTEEIAIGAESQALKITLADEINDLEEFTVLGKSELREVEERAFNVTVLDARKLHHTNLDLGHALDRVSGVRVRESGGVGSRMNFSLNGFSGKQVKFFIDGIPMDDFGSSFQLNNIPINLAERIEVYKGVVPIGLGADALGGAVNIVTKNVQKNYVDVSYSYGSFNTHRTVINTAFVSKSGFTVQLNAFQNYSDNNYWVDVDVADIETGKYYPNQRVRRFHDTYHNETVIAQLGVQGKPYADKLLVGLTAGKNYSEVQTGARLVTVFGDWHRRGTILMPTFKYRKRDLFVKGLDVNVNANYNFGSEQNIDTVNRRYNWFRQYRQYDVPGGERSYTLYKFNNNNAVVTANAHYNFGKVHTLALSNVFNSFNRIGSDALSPDNDRYEQPRKSQKNITGLSYQLNWEEKASFSAFTKIYNQTNYFSMSYNPTGNYGDVAYRNEQENFTYPGFGVTGSYFVTGNIQAKASFEKSYRLPEPEELFGDMVNLQGNLTLKPETSYNYNVGLSIWKQLSANHRLDLSSNGFYRDAKDFIRPRLNNNQAMQVMDNLYSVTNIGVEGEVRWTYKNLLSAGANITYQNLLNNTEFEEGQSIPSLVYRDRVPNMPYLFGNGDVSVMLQDAFGKGNDLNFGYNLLYVHAFYLYWPSMGSDKFDVPEQLSHDVNVTYTTGKKGKLQLIAECRNIADSKLYDNFSLQKPGRNFSGKIRYFIY
ncbi:outer membrane receptor protein involved in Fe transport [Algoriphagus sp. 4150]|uniref:TonB-dependent receptor n=1 Tax=Algoriphagus sp. 4150 TaxID=2817756 RepID=UPI002856F360|nr:TonB-dependent receptor plug domain-containing protein [Algoriphagus sp. 4150]MDR7130308.1 outer membrane receptor protein involved in Fe transport [Algoriphagus sp. 4150]